MHALDNHDETKNKETRKLIASPMRLLNSVGFDKNHPLDIIDMRRNPENVKQIPLY